MLTLNVYPPIVSLLNVNCRLLCQGEGAQILIVPELADFITSTLDKVLILSCVRHSCSLHNFASTMVLEDWPGKGDMPKFMF